MHRSFPLAVCLAVYVSLALTSVAVAEKLNVLFIAVDDLRPELACYGHPVVKSPHIDRIAARGTLFERAYCQQAVCSPSRSSLLTGCRPDTTQVYDLETHFRTHIPDVVTLPQYFKNNGYFTQGMGKIYHGGFDDKPSWSVPHANPKAPHFGPEGQALMKKLTSESKTGTKAAGKKADRIRGLPWEAPEVADNQLHDGALADMAVSTLDELAKKPEQPFFLAVGFLKPHLPFVAPKKYWDLYRPEQIQLAANPQPPKDAPAYAPHTWGELRAYHGMPQGTEPLSAEQARQAVHGYWAAVSYMDTQVGRVLDALDRLKLADKTVVILWGDHGWQLGEHGLWCKHTNYETSARAALVMSVPGQKAAGKKTRALVEFVDIYPTLADVCGLPTPAGVEGTSFRPLLDDAERAWKPAAFGQYPRSVPQVGRVMGYSIRTDRYRLVEWGSPAKKFAEYELYDHERDPGENLNLAKLPEHAETVKQLTAQLHAGWKEAKPK